MIVSRNFGLKHIWFVCLAAVTCTTSLHSQNEHSNLSRTIYVDMVALDQPFFYNRLGASQPTGMIFALRKDLVYKSGEKKGKPVLKDDRPLPGSVMLRPDKRPRPFVLRANEGDTIEVTFTNLLYPANQENVEIFGQDFKVGPLVSSPSSDNDTISPTAYPRTRASGFHAMGMELVESINDDASFVGANESSYAQPGDSPRKYTVFAKKEGAYILYSTASVFDASALFPGALANGLFGSVLVQPKTAEYYRSSVTAEDLYYATQYWVNENGVNTVRDKNQSYSPFAKIGNQTIMDIQQTQYPVLDYQAKFPANHAKWPNQYVLKMLDDNNNQIYNDLAAIITGPNAGRFPYWLDSPMFHNVPASPDRRQPYREFAIHYHETFYAVQAFSEHYTPAMTNTLDAGRDQFAINYGSGGIASEILANRMGVGPVANCKDCAYEEFFLSSWALGDPATVVDIPANVNLDAGFDASQANLLELMISNVDSTSKTITPTPGYKATKQLYPDDPANVVQSYMQDHVKMRVLHCGAGVPHVHHQHAHQWLHTPNSDNGHYLDSQILNPGTAWTMEMVYNGSGNRNQTVGDQIFHCHFYPHFAGGMWAMWRVHDVFETGTHLDENGRPIHGSRAYPDAEIKTGTPIAGIVPMPTKAMAPVPAPTRIENGQVVVPSADKSPGYPFFIPGIAGSRAPHPPLDFAVDPQYGVLDGGLPRHVINDEGTTIKWQQETPKDFTKTMGSITAIKLPEEGTEIEQVAMATHERRSHKTLTPEGLPGNFTLNGLPRQQGAPFADPAIDDNGNPVGTKRVYKAANIQLNAVFNKKGWHYPQQRIATLWEDVAPTLNFTKPPEPLFFRANTNEYIEFWHSNLIPEYYELDDFQVRTPTDILGQHIHLVKFDVTSSDGAANGWNYEDGTFAPDMVQHRIHGINEGKFFDYKYDPTMSVKSGNYTALPGDLTPSDPLPIWGSPPEPGVWNGAQTTIQRWYADPLLNNEGDDRTLRTVFTHDHYGPSTHQQAGLYAGLLVEPEGSEWFDPITGEKMGTREDGGPTSWQAVIQTGDPKDDYREFMLEFQDIALTYNADSKGELDKYPNINDPIYYTTIDSVRVFNEKAYQAAVDSYTGWEDTPNVINLAGGPHPQLITISGSNGTRTVNYRSEPLPLRTSSLLPTNQKNVFDPSSQMQNVGGTEISIGDLAYAMSSRIEWEDPKLNSQPKGLSRISQKNDFVFPEKAIGYGMQPSDPYTPLMRAYENDRIQLRTLVGAHQLAHMFVTPGQRWLFEPAFGNSSIRNSQAMGISEHFEFLFTMPVTSSESKGDDAVEKTIGGKSISFSDHPYIPSADQAGLTNGVWGLMRAYDSYSGIEADSLMPLRNNTPKAKPQPDCSCPPEAEIVSYNVAAIQTNLVFYKNKNGTFVGDTNSVVFVDLDKVPMRWNESTSSYVLVNPNQEIKPLVLRANAGQCIQVTLYNRFDPSDPNYFVRGGGSVEWGNGDNEETYNYYNSTQVSLNPQSLYADNAKDLGLNVGFNNFQTIGPSQNRTYTWYAGNIETIGSSECKATPIEFGAVNLSAPDYINQYTQGLFGGLIVEPAGSNYAVDKGDPTQAYIYDNKGDLLFREMVLFVQDNPNNLFNYKMEPMYDRLGYPSGANMNAFDNLDLSASNTLENGQDPHTPVFTVQKGIPFRMRILKPGGTGIDIITLHGHNFPEEPFIENGTVQGINPLTQQLGSRGEVGALSNYNLLFEKAGGEKEITGDYLLRTWEGDLYKNGAWGIVRVSDEAHMEVAVVPDKNAKLGWVLTGYSVLSHQEEGEFPDVTLEVAGRKPIALKVNPKNGSFTYEFKKKRDVQKVHNLKSSVGGKVSIIPTDHMNTHLDLMKYVDMIQFEAPEVDERSEKYINVSKGAIIRK